MVVNTLRQAVGALLVGLLAAFSTLSATGGEEAVYEPAPGAAVVPVQPGDRPNIVLILADDHTRQAISAYGSRLTTTPGIDRIAHEGMLFERALVPNSICAPARATLLTGLYSHKHGVRTNDDHFDTSQTTFPQLLRDAGYQTALIGKWHLKAEPKSFDHFDVLTGFGGQGDYYDPEFLSGEGTYEEDGYVTDILTEKALEWMSEARDPARPFLLMLQHKAPHREWSPAVRHLTQYRDLDLPEPATLFDDYDSRALPAHTQRMRIGEDMLGMDLKLSYSGRLSDEERAAYEKAYAPGNEAAKALEGKGLTRWRYQRYVKDYLRTAAALDESVGQVLSYLDESGLTDNTIVIYSSDQGMFLGEHGWFDKRWIYEESLTTPLMIRWPGRIAAGSRSGAMVAQTDVAPTLLDLAGVAVPPSMQGRSMRTLLRGGPDADWRQSFYYHFYEYPGFHGVRRHYGVVTPRYKLVHFYEPDIDAWELYDRETDPLEMKNLIGDPAYAAVRAELEGELKRLQTELGEEEPDGPVYGFFGYLIALVKMHVMNWLS